MKKAFRLMLLLLIIFSLILPTCAVMEEDDRAESDWETEYDEARNTYCRLDGDTMTLMEGVVTLGNYYGEKNEYGSIENDPEIEALFNNNPGQYLFFSGEWIVEDRDDFHNIIWPSSIRMIGENSFVHLNFNTLTLPASLEHIYDGAFVFCSFKTFRIECAVPVEQIYYSMYDSYVDAYEVPEDHPLYKTIDGVLYSKDGKSLLLYPESKEDEHFDVPAGVECIAKHAFCGNDYLKTVSLPIGLKTLEDYAFSGCTSLQSIALPLTVTHIGVDAFYCCLALERVSLPAGLEADKDDSWCVYYPDDSLFRGDNWDTSSKAPSRESSESWMWADVDLAWLKDVDKIPVYETESSVIPISAIPGGIPVHIEQEASFMAKIARPVTNAEIGWVDIKLLDYCVTNTLFTMEIKPTKELIATYNIEPDDPYWDWYQVEVEGPWAHFSFPDLYVPLSAVELYRDPLPGSGSDALGIIWDNNYLKKLPLLDAPDGEKITDLHMGTQVRILEEQKTWACVTTGYDTGWIKKESVRIVPVTPGTEEE
ncbi:leucine-rich repeat domain-containing protein [Clostridiales bacterium FE2011]|nr:leucine-rich repeat domain-containing protein [Clostridiales bacterium FE2011]